MTAQIQDPIFYEGEKWSFLSSTSEFRIHPADYGMTPVAPCTACWDGYYGVYLIENDELFVERLYVCLGRPTDDDQDEPEYPLLFGVEASKTEEAYGFDHCYDLHEKIDFSGRILMGNHFIREYYIHAGYQRYWAYEEVYEMEFENGKLIAVKDYSKEAEKKRYELEQSMSSGSFVKFYKK